MDDVGEPRVLFFSGKGGVGKTTLAGTASLRLADAGRRVLVASTDPAHSLRDLFDCSIGGEAVAVAAGVDALEVDATATVNHMLEGLGPLGEASGVAALADLLRLASNSPGVDEIVSLDLLIRQVERPEYDAVVLDTAPTGHTLRLLALPELMDRYFGRLLALRGQVSKLGRRFRRLLRGLRGADELGALDGAELGDELAGARGRMQRLGELLRDPARCALVLVTIPEAMSVLETTRTLELLESQGMGVSAVAVNMVQPAQPGCAFCSARRRAHEAQLEEVRRLVGRVPVVAVEHTAAEPRGLAALRLLADLVWTGRDELLCGPTP
jgi:arsenite-transporting ATPase